MGAVERYRSSKQRHYCPSCGMVGSEFEFTEIRFVKVNGLLKSLRHPMTHHMVSVRTGVEESFCVGGMVKEKAP